MDPEARPLFSTFGLNDKLSNYAAMVARFMAHFIHPLNECSNRVRLSTRAMQNSASWFSGAITRPQTFKNALCWIASSGPARR